MVKLLATAFCLLASLAHAQIPVTVETTTGQAVCNPAASLVPIPGYPDLYLGRVIATGTVAYCAAGQYGTTEPHLGIFQLTWPAGVPTFTLQYSLFTGLPKTVNGISIRTIYDPTVTLWNGQLWAAAECTPSFGGVEYVSACVFPLAWNPATSALMVVASQFNVPVVGVNSGGVTVSASVPVIATFQGSLYLYWTNDSNQDTSPSFLMVSRGAELTLDANGLPWVVPGTMAAANTPTIVHDVSATDTTANHQAAIRAVWPDRNGVGLYALTTLGGTAGGVCANPASRSQGCFRAQITYTTAPLGYNVFADNPQPAANIPANGIDYPHPITTSAGVSYFFGEFFPPTGSWVAGYAPAIAACDAILTNTACLIPFPVP